MTIEQARTVRIGDTVSYQGVEYTVTSIKLMGVDELPWFGLDGVAYGHVSYRFCGYVGRLPAE